MASEHAESWRGFELVGDTANHPFDAPEGAVRHRRDRTTRPRLVYSIGFVDEPAGSAERPPTGSAPVHASPVEVHAFANAAEQNRVAAAHIRELAEPTGRYDEIGVLVLDDRALAPLCAALADAGIPMADLESSIGCDVNAVKLGCVSDVHDCDFAHVLLAGAPDSLVHAQESGVQADGPPETGPLMAMAHARDDLWVGVLS